MHDDNLEKRLLLPWYVNRSLDRAQQEAIKENIARDPSLAAEAEWLDALRHQVKQDVPLRSDDAGLDRLMARIEAEKAGKVTPLPLKQRGWRPAWLSRGFALAATLILAQTVVIAVQFENTAKDTLAPLSAAGPTTKGVRLQVVFNERATEAELRAAVNAVQGDIVSGPGALGVYVLRVERTGAEAALLRLRKNTAVVESVTKEEQK